MTQNITLVGSKSKRHFYGLDVHEKTISISFAEEYGEPVYLKTIESGQIEEFFKSRIVPGVDIYTVYEAGGCGFVLHALLEGMGITNIVAAPSKITKTPSENKNDKLDSLKLTRLLRNHIVMGFKELHEVYVPDSTTQAMQDVTRTRDYYKRQVKQTMNKILAFVRKYGFRYNQTRTNWTATHRAWLEKLDFRCPIKQSVYRDLLNYLHTQEERVKHWDKELDKLVETWNQKCLAKALCALKGIQMLTSASIIAEIGDFGRFEKARNIMSYVGLNPTEYSSGNSVTRGRISKAGNKRVRTLLIEAAQAARRVVKSKNAFLASAPEGIPPEVLDHAYKAQVRLNKTYYRLLGQGKNSCVATVAVARELIGFIWAIADMMKNSTSGSNISGSEKEVSAKTA